MELAEGRMNTKEMKDKASCLEDVYTDMLRFGCLRIFRHFDLYLRGREELLVTVRAADSSSSRTTSLKGRSFGSMVLILTICKLPTAQSSSVWRNHQRQTNQRPLPPASPASSELKQAYAGETLFLVGVYGRYKFRPYVWLRSQRSEYSSSSGFDPDVPLLLQTTSDWETNSNLRIWDVVEELVDLNWHSVCDNPYEIDFEALSGLPPVDRLCMAADMASFLEDLLKRLTDHRPSCASALKSDMRRLLEIHFKDLRGVIPAYEPATRSDAVANIAPMKSYRV